MSLRIARLMVSVLLLFAGGAFASGNVRRYALAAGANYGGPGRPALSYAVSDAESFARVMETLGGVDPSDLVLLSQPSLIELEDALHGLRKRLASAEDAAEVGPGGRTEVVVYFSGHANETGLLLGEETFSYRSLRNWMDLVEADVRIAVLDACASGIITRLKGGRRTKAFLVDASAEMRGHAFLTSSSADEVAQESDRIGGSFFTHFLVSGLRGAADISGEGKVTLNEAYQFAFQETLGRTTQAQGGVQHPSYDIELSGTGDVVMTDVRGTSAVLELSEELSGRFFVRDSQQRLAVELYKPRGRRVELALEPDTYEIRCEGESGFRVAAAALEEGGQRVLGPQHFTPTDPEMVKLRGAGPADARFGSVDGRWRLGLRLGYWSSGGLGSPDSDFSYNAKDTIGALTVSHWLSEDWSIDLTAWTTMSLVQSEHLTPDDVYVAAFLLGGKRHFSRVGGLGEMRPFVSAAAGPYLRHARAADGTVVKSVAAGGHVSAGLDVQVAEWCLLEARAGYGFTSDFTDDFTGTFGIRSSYSGLELSAGVSVLFGGKATPGS